MASPFASLTTSEPIPLPFDSGQWVKVRKLTGAEYEAAQVAHRIDFINGNKWAGLFREAIEQGPSAAAVAKALADPLTGFSRYELIGSGLVAWSYDRPIDADTVKDLDDDAVEFIARAVLQLTKPRLFDAADQAEDAKVKD